VTDGLAPAGSSGTRWGAPARGEPAAFDHRDADAVAEQLGRRPRAVAAVAHRCPCGHPDVLLTHPRLDDGTPFPTTFYATCPRLTAALSALESSGLMQELNRRLAEDPDLAGDYRRAHENYLARRDRLEVVPQLAGISAGGMPERVKCLHVLAAHALGAGPGENPLGDEVLAALPPWWERPCVPSRDPGRDERRPGGSRP
jgi:hypothetical protein